MNKISFNLFCYPATEIVATNLFCDQERFVPGFPYINKPELYTEQTKIDPLGSDLRTSVDLKPKTFFRRIGVLLGGVWSSVNKEYAAKSKKITRHEAYKSVIMKMNYLGSCSYTLLSS